MSLLKFTSKLDAMRLEFTSQWCDVAKKKSKTLYIYSRRLRVANSLLADSWPSVPVVQTRFNFADKSYVGDCSGNIARVKTSFTGSHADQTQCSITHIMKKRFVEALAA
jgi:hypothetical protein